LTCSKIQGAKVTQKVGVMTRSQTKGVVVGQKIDLDAPRQCRQPPAKKKPSASATPAATKQSASDSSDEECWICCGPYGPGPQNWIELDCCKNKLCKECHSRLTTTGTTMSGKKHTYMKCPFCQECSGVQIGTCPNGTMTRTDLESKLPGYGKYNTIMVQYYVNQGKYHLNRIGYLPASPEGNRVYNLLRIAWDRRHCFTIGNSLTTGQQDCLVWNIHHKTSTHGGPTNYGYPDAEYLQRVLDELKQYNIE